MGGNGGASSPTMGGVEGCVNEAADLVQRGGGSPIRIQEPYKVKAAFVEIIHCCKSDKN